MPTKKKDSLKAIVRDLAELKVRPRCEKIWQVYSAYLLVIRARRILKGDK